MELLVGVCVLLKICAVLGNIVFYHTKSFVEITPSNVPQDGYFGYSCAYDYMSKNLIVSAPNADSVGQVFSCNLNERKCEQITDDLFEGMKNDSISIEENYKLSNHKFWLGATIRTAPGLIMICAPRYATRNLQYNESYQYYGTRGRCLFKDRNEWKFMLYPNNTNDLFYGNLENMMTSLGWSAYMTKSISLIGGPAMGLDKKGLTIVLQNDLITAPTFLFKQNIPEYQNLVANFGYSVVVGSFFDKKGYFAVSSTYGHIGIGKVYIFKYGGELHSTITGPEVVGIMYGAALCAAKLRGAQDDLIVGAPTYSKSAEYYDSGAVFIYSVREKIYYMDLVLTLTGQYTGGYFGSSIINLGDVDGDRMQDIAIAAPYENEGRGNVYIYSGEDLKNSETKPLQRLHAEAKTFGLSLATFPDYSQNGCKGLIIGAPSLNSPDPSKVVVVNCFTFITTNVKVDCGLLDNTVPNATLFRVKSCVNVVYPKKPKRIKANIEMKVKVDQSQARLVNNKSNFSDLVVELTYNKTVDKNEMKVYCEEDIVILPDEANYNLEIIVTVTAKLVNSPANEDSFDSSQALLTKRSQLFDKCFIFPNYCNKTQCKPNLHLQVTPEWRYDEPYLVGSSENAKLSMSVSNEGEVAYAACVRVETRGVAVVALPSWRTSRCACARDDPACAVFTCEPNVHIDNGQTWVVGEVILDTKPLNSDNSSFSIIVYVYNNCAGNVSDFKNITTDLKYDYENIVLEGKSEGHQVNVMKSDVENRKQLKHLYDVQNNGVTYFKRLKGIVTIRKSPYYFIPVSTIKVITESGSAEECVVLKESDVTYTAKCILGDLLPGGSIGVTADIQITEFENNEKKERPVFYSEFKLLFSDENKYMQTNVSTIIKYQIAEAVAWWVILAAVILGILLVILVIFLLYEAGCLKRKNKERLLDLKKEVRRQSVRRSMRLRESVRSSVRMRSTSDGVQLLEPGDPDTMECKNDLYQSADGAHEVQMHPEPNKHSKSH